MSRKSWTGCCAAAAIPVWVCVALFAYLLQRALHDFRNLDPFTKGAYVTGRPDLTYNTDADDIQRVNQQLAAFLRSHGLSVADARDLRIATGVHYKHGLLFTFVMTPEKQKKLLRGKRRLRVAAASVLTGSLGNEPQVRSVIPPETAEQTARGALSYLGRESPFNRLEWWPPPESRLREMRVYRGPIQWRQPEISPRTSYLFVAPGSGSVYVAATS
ncbi:MAG TPA: hypothetical protein VK689_07395 [Armatimonadota bacterium]|nr:hypothetical protein [Armatimonadota bacterium]